MVDVDFSPNAVQFGTSSASRRHARHVRTASVSETDPGRTTSDWKDWRRSDSLTLAVRMCMPHGRSEFGCQTERRRDFDSRTANRPGYLAESTRPYKL